MSRKLSKQEFKDNWESDNCDITWDDITQCAIDWDISSMPKTTRMFLLGNMVLKAAGLEAYFEIEESK